MRSFRALKKSDRSARKCKPESAVLFTAEGRFNIGAFLKPRPLIDLLELLLNDRGCQRQIPAFALDAFLALLAEDKVQELAHLRVHRLPGITVRGEKRVMRQRIGVVAHGLQCTFYVRAALARLNCEFFRIWGKRYGRRGMHRIMISRDLPAH